MSLKERVAQELERLSEDELRQIADYLAFLKFQGRGHSPSSAEEARWAALYAEFAEEDRSLAQEGMADYASGLVREDTA